MGCSSTKTTEDQLINNDTSSILNIPNDKNPVYHIKRKGGKEYEEPIKKLGEHEELVLIAQEEIEILNQFNSKFNNNEGITLANLSQYYLHSNKENTNIISLSSNEKIIKCLKNINPFNENIDENNEINLLKSKLVKIETKHPKLIKPISPLFHLNLTQVIHQDYDFSFKLKNVITNKYKIFKFNKLDRPIIFIFFDILSFESVNKIKEFKIYEKEVINNENKNFLLIPIMNVFVQEKENLDEQKKYLESIDINEDCYILTQVVNSSFIKLFELDCVTQSKCVIVNRNSEISLILEDHIEFLTKEMIDFYLNTRNSEYTNDYFKNEDKNELKNILQKKEYQNILENFTQKFNLEIEFKEIESKKYPVNIRFMYHQKDSKNAENILSKLKNYINSKIKRYFIGEYIIQDKKQSLLKAMDYLKEKLNKIDNNINITNSSFILFNQSSSIYNSNNDITKNKKYILKYYLNDISYFNQTLDILSSNLYNNPQFSQLGCGHCIIPTKGLKMNKIIENCREVKLFTDKKSQLKYQNKNADINFNLEENNIEAIILINPNIFVNNEGQKEKIKNLFEILNDSKIHFLICVFSYNELDAQKLRYLSWDKIYSGSLSKKTKKEKKDKKIKINVDALDDQKNFKIIYLNSTLPQNYSALGYYTEDITFKLIHIKNNCEIINFYDLDIYNLNELAQENLSDKNIFDYLDYLSEKNNYNNISNINNDNYEKEIKMFKKNKKDILSNIIENKYLSKIKNYKCTILNFSFIYEKNLIFEDDNKFNNYKTKYHNIQVNLTYLDYIDQYLKIDKIKSIIEENNKNTSVKYTLNTRQLQTINLFHKSSKTFICSQCLKEKNFNNESFYMCYFCTDIKYMICRDCYEDLYINSKEKKEDDDFFKDFVMTESAKKNEGFDEEEKLFEKIHKHPLLFLFNFEINKKSYIIKELYDKYIQILMNKSNKKIIKSEIKVCSVCSNYLFEDSKNINVVLSHIKTENDYSQYSKNYEEIFICNNCFQTNEYQNMILKEENDNNFVILRLLTD